MYCAEPGNLLLKLNAGNLVVGGGEHALIDVLESLEAVEVAGARDDAFVSGAPLAGHAGPEDQGAAAA